MLLAVNQNYGDLTDSPNDHFRIVHMEQIPNDQMDPEFGLQLEAESESIKTMAIQTFMLCNLNQ